MEMLGTNLLKKIQAVGLQQWEIDRKKYAEIHEQTDHETLTILSLTFQTDLDSALTFLRKIDLFLAVCLLTLYVIGFGWLGSSLILDSLPTAFHWWQILFVPFLFFGAIFSGFYIFFISTFVSIPAFFLFRWLIGSFSSQLSYLHCLNALNNAAKEQRDPSGRTLS